MKIGDEVIYKGLPNGAKIGSEVDGRTHWFSSGAVGKVVRFIPGYPRHRCPDHGKAPDCVCGGNGWVPAEKDSAVGSFPCDCGSQRIERCV